MKNFKKLIKEAYLGNPLNEATDFNDPALIKARAAQMKRDEMDKEEAEYKAKQAALDKKYGSNFMDKLDAELDLKAELSDLEDEREDVIRNMEEEAEPEGGPIADDYGSILNDMDARIAAIKSELEDLRMYESVNENEDSYVKVSQPRFIKDKKNPNFLFVRMNYDTGPGVGIALGKETMAGQIRRLSSQEAMRRAKEIARNLEQMFDVEDIDIVDMENGTVEIFAVSDDFENMDPKSEFSWNGYKYGLKSLNEEFSSTEQKMIKQIKSYKKRGSAMVTLPSKTRDFYFKNKEKIDALNEELKLGVKYELPTGETGYIMTGGSKDPKDWKFSANKESYLLVKDKLKPIKKQPGKYDGAYDMGMGKGHHIDEGTCGYTPDGEPRSKPAGPDLNEAEIPLWLTDNREFEKAVIVSTSYNDFEKRVYHILGPKYFKLALTQQPGVFKDYYDSIRVTRPNLEEESDTDVGGGAKQAIGLDIDDAHSGDAALDNEVNSMFEEDLTENTEEKLAIMTDENGKFIIGMAKGEFPRSKEAGPFDTQKQACDFFGKKEDIILKNLTEDNRLNEFAANKYEVIGDVYSSCAINESKGFNFKQMVKEALTPNIFK